MKNLVWKHYIIQKLPHWAEWFKNNPYNSHLEMLERFIISNPYFVPQETNVYAQMNEHINFLVLDKEFFNSLSDKGLKVWYYSSFSDFIKQLKTYERKFLELKMFINLYSKYAWWFDRVYAKVRMDMAETFSKEGRNFK